MAHMIMNKYIIALLLLLPTKSIATDKDYGLSHGVVNLIAGEVLTKINNILLPDNPNVSKYITNIELGLLTYYWCNKEAKARGTWQIDKWYNISGSYDSTFDCLTPAAISGLQIYNDGFSINIIDYKW